MKLQFGSPEAQKILDKNKVIERALESETIRKLCNHSIEFKKEINRSKFNLRIADPDDFEEIESIEDSIQESTECLNAAIKMINHELAINDIDLDLDDLLNIVRVENEANQHD